MGGIAHAQAAANGPGPFVSLLPLVLVFAVFYFLLIRPQQRKAKEHQAMVANLKRNDEVVTAGGLHGRIVELGEKTITLEIAPNVRVRVDRPRVEAVIRGKGSGEKGGKER
jgi:preprotein translocase subunit YajC